MIKALSVYDKMRELPMGKYIFSKIVCLMAPYFKTIKPRFIDLKPGYCEIRMNNRRAVRNHLKSVHAIAMCNLCELAGGMALDAALPANLRWIPKGMKVDYIKIARTNLKGVCSIPGETIPAQGSIPVTVSVTDATGTEVMKAVINMHITEKKGE
ncbi:MAG: DUF4442 domain-containing protein [Spirochaetes bacterium]|nr:DUF4442 domain-containing protein [Spirochaetota bacterium]